MKSDLLRLSLALSLALTLFTCSDLEKTESQPPQQPPVIDYTFVHFDPASGNPADIALPNDILRNPATGRNAIPLTGEPYDSLNKLSGFSTSAPIIIPFKGHLKTDSVSASTVLLLDLADLQLGNNPARSAGFSVVNNPQTGNATLVVMPVTPLKPGRPHAVVITDKVLGLASGRPVQSQTLTILLKSKLSFLKPDGTSARSALDNASAAKLEPLRMAYQNIWAAAEAVTQQDRLQIPFAFAFTTQPLHGTLTAMRERLQSETPLPTVAASFVGSAAVDALYAQLGLSAAPHAAVGQVYAGTYSSPNFMPHPLAGEFIGSGAEVQEVSRLTQKFWAAMPANTSGPIPVIVFGHGFTSRKEAMFALANTACTAGFGIIAIDFPLHGERVGDFFNNETGNPGPDGQPDLSGTGFINPARPTTMRDNFRQTILDYVVLTRMISSGATDFNGDSIPDFAPTAIVYAGQSGGGILGSGLLPIEPNLKLGVLNVPGGRFFSLFQYSAEVTPIINRGLAAAGILPGSAEYTLFFLILGTVLDDVDPFNLASHMLSGDLSGGVANSVLVQEMMEDSVVPNVSTTDLARSIGLKQVKPVLQTIPGLTSVDAPYVGSGLFQYQGGVHGFLLAPDPNTAAGQLQLITYLGSGLQGNPTIIDPFASNKKLEAWTQPALEENLGRMVYFPAGELHMHP